MQTRSRLPCCLIKRGNEVKDIVFESGELVYCYGTNSFYVGDGKTSMLELKPYNNLVKGENGKIYAVTVDKSGNPQVEETYCYDRIKMGCKKAYQLKVEEN